MTKITNREQRLIKERRREARANLTIEGIHLTSEEEALFEYMDRKRLSHDERRERLTVQCNLSFKVPRIYLRETLIGRLTL